MRERGERQRQRERAREVEWEREREGQRESYERGKGIERENTKVSTLSYANIK